MRHKGAMRKALPLLFLCLVAASSPPSPQQRQQHENAATAQNATNAQANPSAAENSPEYTAPCGPSQDRRNSDLCAQWKAADAARDAANAARESAEYNWWQLWVGVIGASGLLGALGLALHANWIARDTAKRQLRAYINTGEITASSASKDNTEWKIQIEWVNGGATPAKTVIGCLRSKIVEGDLPDDFDFPTGQLESGTMVLGPRAKFASHVPRNLTFSEMQTAAAGGSRIFVWGWIEYSDIFSRKRHRTECAFEFCIEELPGLWGMVFVPLRRHNGMDEGCMKQPR